MERKFQLSSDGELYKVIHTEKKPTLRRVKLVIIS